MGEARQKAWSIRPAKREDLAEVLRIERESFPSPWQGDMFASELEEELALFLVMEAEGEFAGFTCARVVREEGHVLKIAVAPELRRRGLGRELMDVLLLEMRKRGVETTWLEVRQSNWPGRAFYRAFGFHDVGVRRRYYADNNEDAVVMAKTI